jgi:hypothetical protein
LALWSLPFSIVDLEPLFLSSDAPACILNFSVPGELAARWKKKARRANGVGYREPEAEAR